MNEFRPDEIVWAKLPNWPPWPAVIDRGNDRETYTVILLGTGQVNVVQGSSLSEWNTKKPKKELTTTKNHVYSEQENLDYKNAVKEAAEMIGPAAQDDSKQPQCAECKGGTMRDDEDGVTDSSILICDGCDQPFHLWCCAPPLSKAPDADWFCQQCVAKDDPVSSMVASALCNVLSQYRSTSFAASFGNPAWDEPMPNVRAEDLVEVAKGCTSRPARVVHRRTAQPVSGLFLQYEALEPASGVWQYYSKENETLEDIAMMLYPEAASRAVCEVIIRVQATHLQQHARLDRRLKAHTEICLPEYSCTHVENETPRTIAKRFGRSVEALVGLNRKRVRTLPNALALTEQSKLRKDTVLILPPARVPFAMNRPSGPLNGPSAPSEDRLAAAISAGRAPLKLHEAIMVEYKATEEGEPVWRLGTVRVLPDPSDESGTFAVSGIGGDHGFLLDDLHLHEEGQEWMRLVVWPSPFQEKPNGRLGSGALLPPFAAARRIERFTQLDFQKLVSARPPPPPGNWHASLEADADCEVLIDGEWHAAFFEKLTDSQSGRHLSVALEDRENEIVVCQPWQLRHSRDVPVAHSPPRRQVQNKRQRSTTPPDAEAEEERDDDEEEEEEPRTGRAERKRRALLRGPSHRKRPCAARPVRGR